MAQGLFGLKPLREPEVYDGIIAEAVWDRHDWTLQVDMIDAGRRMVQIPAYHAIPRAGDKVKLFGRNPLLRAEINGEMVSLDEPPDGPSESLSHEGIGAW